MRRPLLILATAAVALPLAACAGDSAGSAGVERILSSIPADANTLAYVEFGDHERLREVWDGTLSADPWAQLAGVGASNLATYAVSLEETLAVDLTAASTLVSAGMAPYTVVVVAGSQDADAVRDAATAAGWRGQNVLETEVVPAQPLSITSPQIRPEGDRVVFGSMSADVGGVGEPARSLLDNDAVRTLVTCLDDVVAAMVLPTAGTPLAVGVRIGPDERPQSVLCVMRVDPGTIEDAVTNDANLRGQPWADYFASVEVTESEGATRAVLDNTEAAPPMAILSMLHAGDLPGVSTR
ncbi:MAG: hypothetical protein ACTMIR_00270 [Cellulomonadaceae bacterium]